MGAKTALMGATQNAAQMATRKPPILQPAGVLREGVLGTPNGPRDVGGCLALLMFVDIVIQCVHTCMPGTCLLSLDVLAGIQLLTIWSSSAELKRHPNAKSQGHTERG